MLTRSSAEIAAALATATIGLIIMVGALEFGIGWDSSGPGAGSFPFFMGALVAVASVVNLVQAIAGRSGLRAVFLDREQGKRLASFSVPVALFVPLALFLGIYVATALYLTAIMRLQGGYRLSVSVLTGLGAAAFFYTVLEVFFQVPLLKGPLEAAMGLH